MISLEIIKSNLLSPVVLSFYLGVFAKLLKSDLKFPDSFFSGLSAYLLLAIGLKGGVALTNVSFYMLFSPILATFTISLCVPSAAFLICKYIAHLKKEDAAAIAAHYGSVSIVTFIATKVFLENAGLKIDEYMTGLVALLELPGIIFALLLAQNVFEKKAQSSVSFFDKFTGIFLSKSIYLLWGGLLIGILTGPEGFKKVAPFFVDPFYGMLVFFMLEMGLVAGTHIEDLKKIKGFLALFAVGMPILSGSFAIFLAKIAGFSLANATVFAAMAASASYIAAPAAVRIALPSANPSYYLTSSLVITFPFNLSLGIPLYYMLTKWWYQL